MSRNAQVTRQWLLLLVSVRVDVQTSRRQTRARMPREIARRFGLAFRVVAANRGGARLVISKLRDREGYRLRIGGRRALHRIDGERLIIEVMRIDCRGSVYK